MERKEGRGKMREGETRGGREEREEDGEEEGGGEMGRKGKR